MADNTGKIGTLYPNMHNSPIDFKKAGKELTIGRRGLGICHGCFRKYRVDPDHVSLCEECTQKQREALVGHGGSPAEGGRPSPGRPGLGGKLRGI